MHINREAKAMKTSLLFAVLLCAGISINPSGAVNITCAGRIATIVGSAAGERILGTRGPDVIQGLGGNDLILGLGGNDLICGGLGNDNVNGVLGNDQLYGGPGNDTVNGGFGIDQLNGNQGRDRCNGGPPASGDSARTCEQVTGVGASGIPGGGTPGNGTAMIPPNGGAAGLQNIASASFPAGAFSTQTQVTVSQTSSPTVQETYDESASIFRPSNRLGYEVRINTGTLPPATDTIHIVLNVPNDFLASVPSDYGIELLVQFFEDGGEETLDTWDIIPSIFDAGRQVIEADVPSAAFTNTRGVDGSYEAIMLLAATPGAKISLLKPLILSTQQAAACGAAAIICPLTTGCEVTSRFSPARKHPIYGTTRRHAGIDLRAATGSEIVAAATGIVERSYRSPTYGETIVIRHADGGATLYAHLQTRAVQERATVTEGQPIGISDNTGASEGPHLHFEYVPNGKIIQSKNRIDPFPCIGAQLASGSITVRDNGNAADDAFRVFFDGVLLGQTAVGQLNSLAVSNLRPGTHQLQIVAIIAPDDDGTYEVSLSNGLTFSDSTTSKVGDLTQGGSVTFSVIVPGPPPTSPPPR